MKKIIMGVLFVTLGMLSIYVDYTYGFDCFSEAEMILTHIEMFM